MLSFARTRRTIFQLTTAAALGAIALTSHPSFGQSASVIAAGRILNQATLGPSVSDMNLVESTGISNYLNYQLSQPAFVMKTALTDVDFYGPDCWGWQCEPEEQWYQDLVFGQDQLRERVAWELSKLFVVSGYDVDPRYLPYYMNVLNRDAFGNWFTLMQDVALSPAMGQYLNMANSLYTPSATGHADENFGRELMQVFSIGVNALNQDGSLQSDGNGNPIPNYDDAIVQDFARAFTGYTLSNMNCSAPSTPLYYSFAFPWGEGCAMVPLGQYHDPGAKTLLRGVTLPSGQSAATDVTDALQNVFNDPSLPPFVSKQLIKDLVKSNPTPAYISRVAAVFTNNGSGVRGDMPSVLKAILLDPEARADDAGGTPDPDTGRLRDPLLTFTSVMRTLGVKEVTALPELGVYPSNLAYWLEQMSEQPWGAASVFSFYSPSFTVTTNGTTLSAPEFEIETTQTVPTISEGLQFTVDSNFSVPVALPTELSLDLSATSPLGVIAANQGATGLVNALNAMLMHGTMSAEMQQVVIEGISSDKTVSQAVKDAVFLVVSSPQYRVMI